MLRIKNSAISDFNSVEEDANDYSEIEAEILAFCQQTVKRVKAALSKTYAEGKEIGNIDAT